jgi:glc operon protein GlcG
MLFARRWILPVPFTGLCALLAASTVGSALAQQESSQIRDVAGMFSLDAVRKARAELDRIERESHIPILIETIDSTRGGDIDELALRRARQWGTKGIYVLIAQKEHKIRVRDFQSFLGHERRVKIQEAFSERFAKKDYDGGLEDGIAAIRDAVTSALKEAGPRKETAEKIEPSETGGRFAALANPQLDEAPLVLRNQVHLTLAGARRILAAAEDKATSMKWKMNIAVVDDGGHLVAFARMDGARPASGYTALTKATTAATFRQATGPLPPGTTSPDLLLNIGLQNAAAASGGKVTTLYGGVPIVIDGQVIGGVGVGGGTGEQDAEVARAGIAALVAGLQKVPAKRAEAEPPGEEPALKGEKP